MNKQSVIHCRVSRGVKSLLLAAANAKGVRLTGDVGMFTPWVVNTLVETALEELGYDTLEDWIATKKQ